jgi:glucitol operon activator protein
VELGIFFCALAAAWMIQMLLTWQQAKRFMAEVRQLRKQGKVSIGSSGSRMRGRAYVALAVSPEDRVTAARRLMGATVFARPKPVPELVGLSATEMSNGPETLPKQLHIRIREGAASAARMLHPRPGDPPPGARPVPAWRRLLGARGTDPRRAPVRR